MAARAAPPPDAGAGHEPPATSGPGWRPGPLPAALIAHFLGGEQVFKGACTVVQQRLEHQLLFATVRDHIQAIYARLEVSNVVGLVAALRQAE